MGEEEKKVINGGDVLIQCLLEENVKYLFGIIGGQFLTMFDAIYRWGKEKGIQTVMFRHEQAAAHAADAYARVTNEPSVCFGTVGPGALHVVPGIGAAWGDNIPVVTIVPQVNSKFADSFTLQGNLDQITMFKPITKYQISVRTTDKIPDAVHKVFREATSGRPQPVLLELYEDALMGKIEEDQVHIIPPTNYRAINKPAIDGELIRKALDTIIAAKKPIIISGGGVMRAGAWDELKEFAEYLQVPVITTMMGYGTIPGESKCLAGATIAAAIQTAPLSDLIITLGCKFSYIMAHGEPPFWKNTQEHIQVDIDPSIIGRHKPVTLGIIGDCKQFLKQILVEVKKKEKVEKRDWLETLAANRQAAIQKSKKRASRDKIPILPPRLVKDVMEFLEDDGILVVDGGDIAAYVGETIDYYKTVKPLSFIQAIGMGHLGTAVPYGIGAKLGKPDKQVIAITGDGSIMMNIQDLETAVRLGLKNLIFVVANNSAWGMLKSGQKYFMGKRFIDVEFPEFDFARCAEGFGCYGEVVTDSKEIIPALERAKNSNKPAVIDVKIAFGTPDATKLMGSMGIL